jgi:hypothetical protein
MLQRLNHFAYCMRNRADQNMKKEGRKKIKEEKDYIGNGI